MKKEEEEHFMRIARPAQAQRSVMLPASQQL